MRRLINGRLTAGRRAAAIDDERAGDPGQNRVDDKKRRQGLNPPAEIQRTACLHRRAHDEHHQQQREDNKPPRAHSPNLLSK